MKAIVSLVFLTLSLSAFAHESECDRIADAVSSAIIAEQTSPDSEIITARNIFDGRAHYSKDFSDFYSTRNARFQYTAIRYAFKYKKAAVFDEPKPCQDAKFFALYMGPRKKDKYLKADFQQAMREVYCTFLY